MRVVSDSDGRPRGHGGSARRAFDKLVSGIVAWGRDPARSRNPAVARPPTRVMFYFNGGLNAEEGVLEQAASQVPCILSDGVYPVFMVWDTAAGRSYGEQVFKVRDGQIAPLDTRKAVSGTVYILGDVIEGLGRAPSDYPVHRQRYWRAVRRDPVCRQEVRAFERPENGCGEDHRVEFVPDGGAVTAKRNVVVTEPDRVDEHFLEIPQNISYAARWPFRVLTTPFADGFGTVTWDNYLRRTRTTIRRPVEFYLDRGNDPGTVPCPENLREDMEHFPQGTGTFAKVFQLLLLAHEGKPLPVGRWTCAEVDGKRLGDKRESDFSAHPDLAAFGKLDLALTMVGHSMGAIVINELVRKFPELPYRDIVYMAAAASIRETQLSLGPLLLEDLRRPNGPRLHVYNLMLHPLNDARERSDNGSLPSGSLLTWIDEMYEVPKTPEDKTFGYWPNAKAARFIFNRCKDDRRKDCVGDRMLYRVFNRPPVSHKRCPGPPCAPANPHTHGAFNDDHMCFWRPAFWGAAATAWRKDYQDLPPHALRECQVEPKPDYTQQW